MIGIYIIAWLGLMIIGIANGVARNYTYGRRLPELAAHQLSTLIGMILITGYVWLMNMIWPLESAGQAIIIGLIWLGMTVVFEFTFGRYVVKHSWEKLLHDYNLRRGRVWILMLAWTTLAPYAIHVLSEG